MRREKLTFKGIFRNNSEHLSPEGSCEELINLRNDGGLRAIAPKRVIIANKTYRSAIEHTTADFNNLIITINNKVYVVNRTTGTETEIHVCPSAAIRLATVNNMLIILCADAASMVVYQYKGGAYSLMFNRFPAMASVRRVDLVNADTKFIESTKFRRNEAPLVGASAQELKENLIAGLIETRSVDPEFCEGYILVCTSYTLYDGTETKMSPLIMFKLAEYDSTPIETLPYQSSSPFYQEIWLKIQVQRLKVEITLPANVENYADVIKYVNIYCSRPISYYKATQDSITLIPSPSWSPYVSESSTMAANTFNEALFERELMYKQHQIEINKLEESYSIKFGDELLTGKTMPVDSSGWVSVVGKPFMYNNRLHLFDLKRTLVVEQEVFSSMTTSDTLPDATTTAPSSARTPIDYYSYSFVSDQDAWEQINYPTMPVIGTLWYDPVDMEYYTTQFGNTPVNPGWYLYMYGESLLYSSYIAVRTYEIVRAVPSVTTSDATGIGETSANVGMNVTNENWAKVTEKAVAWSVHDNPTTADNKTSPTSGPGSYGSTISGLSPDTTYYFRGYAINSEGTGYGTIKSFKTLGDDPQISRTEVLTYGQDNTVEEAFGSEITGSIWQDDDNDKYYTTEFGSTFVSDNYYVLIKGADVYASQFILIENGVGGVPFYPEPFVPVAPTVVTYDADSITDNSAELGGEVTDGGNFPVTESGIVWALHSDPSTTDNKEVTGSGLDAISVIVDSLTEETIYYFKAYAINDAGTSYGSLKSFETAKAGFSTTTTTTPPPPPPEGIVCNGFDSYDQSTADTRVNSGNYNTVTIYFDTVNGDVYAYTTSEYSSYAQEGYYAVGNSTEGVTRRIQVGSGGIVLYDSNVDGEPSPTSTTTTTTTTAPGPVRWPYNYYGYSADNAFDCFTSELTGTVYVDEGDNKWYTTTSGMTLITDGYYMFEKNSGVEDSEIHQFINGIMQ